MIARMKMYIANGYLDQAFTLAQGIEKIEANTASDAKLKGDAISIKETLAGVRELITDLNRLDIQQYNTKIVINRKILEALKSILPDIPEEEIHFIKEDTVVYPHQLVQALESTRNEIIANHVENIKDAPIMPHRPMDGCTFCHEPKGS